MLARRLTTIAAGVALTLLPTIATGQVTPLSELSFGTVITGTTTSVTPTSASAGSWRIRGILGIAGVITVSAPSTLTKSGGGSMSVTYCSTCGIYRVNNSNPVGGTTFNPNNTIILTITILSDIYLWVGGSVNPPLAQAPGAYSGTMVVTVIPLL